MKKILRLLALPEPAFLLPGIPPIAIGTALGTKAAGELNILLASLALAAIMAINAGSNMLNDYFDHLSGNDWLNTNKTIFGGGSRYIQNGIITPEQMRLAGIIALCFGGVMGISIVLLTKSILILTLGLIGFLAGIFWTMPPFKCCYRFIGEPYIFTVFGILPTFGAYYLQTNQVSPEFLPPAVISGLLIAGVALLNSIPDREADNAVEKKTFVVRNGLPAAIKFYRVLVVSSYIIAAINLKTTSHFSNGARYYLYTIPIGIICLILASEKRLSKPNVNLPNGINILLYIVMGISITIGIATDG